MILCIRLVESNSRSIGRFICSISFLWQIKLCTVIRLLLIESFYLSRAGSGTVLVWVFNNGSTVCLKGNIVIRDGTQAEEWLAQGHWQVMEYNWRLQVLGQCSFYKCWSGKMFNAELHKLFYIGLSHGKPGSKPVVTKLVSLLKFPCVRCGFFQSIYLKMQNDVYYQKTSVLKRVLNLLALLSCSYVGWNFIDTGKYN